MHINHITGRSGSLAALASAALVIAIAIMLAIPMSWSLAPTPAFADEYSDLSELTAQAREIKSRIDAARDEYMVATQKAAEALAEEENARNRLGEIDRELDAERAKLGQLAREAYKSSDATSYIQCIFGAESFSAALDGIDYLRRLSEDRMKSIERISQLEREAAEVPEKMAQKAVMAQEQAASAADYKEAFQSELDAVKPEIQKMRAYMTSSFAGQSGSSQLASILDYMDLLGDSTAAQVAIVNAAYSTGYAGGNRCEAWAEACYRNAGIDVPLVISAYDAWCRYGKSSDKTNIPIGAWLYGSGTSVPYGHVGVLVADNLVMDNEGAAAGHAAVTLDKWLSWQTAVNSGNGQSGWFGWGYPDWVALEAG